MRRAIVLDLLLFAFCQKLKFQALLMRIVNSKKLILGLVFVFLGISLWLTRFNLVEASFFPVVDARVLYARPNASGDCSSWEQACDLQSAISRSVAGDQIWAAAGTYFPTTSTDRSISFVMKSGVAIYGAFPAGGGTWEERDWQINPTILSGDIGLSGNSSDNSYHVIVGTNLDATTILDGFTVTSGNANAEPTFDRGGGMYLLASHPSINQVTFTNNFAGYGGGVYNLRGNPSFTEVTFSNNSCQFRGGGLYDYYGNVTLSFVTFTDNSAQERGGGLYEYDGVSSLTDITFIGNSALDYGGGMFTYANTSTLSRVTFSKNDSVSGGGMYNMGSLPVLSEVTFSENTASARCRHEQQCK